MTDGKWNSIWDNCTEGGNAPSGHKDTCSNMLTNTAMEANTSGGMLNILNVMKGMIHFNLIVVSCSTGSMDRPSWCENYNNTHGYRAAYPTNQVLEVPAGTYQLVMIILPLVQKSGVFRKVVLFVRGMDKRQGSAGRFPGCGTRKGSDVPDDDEASINFCARNTNDYDHLNLMKCCLNEDNEGDVNRPAHKHCPVGYCIEKDTDNLECTSVSDHCNKMTPTCNNLL